MATAQRVWPSLLGLALASVVVFVLHGFTVDDALISARYAFHIAEGVGHRFNAGGPVRDGVTPLPWPYLLAPFAAAGPLSALHAAKLIGSVAWLAAAASLAAHLHGILTGDGAHQSFAKDRRQQAGYLSFLVAFATPSVGAWAASGMETGLTLAVVTLSAILGQHRRWRKLAVLLLGLSGTLRPELMPFVLTLAFGCAWLNESHENVPALARSALGFVALAALPFAVVTALRWFAFGSVAPLAVLAKPSDLQHGLLYAVAACLVAGPPLAVFSPLAWRGLRGWPRWLLLAFGVHTLSIVGVGGDWMPLSRLFVPVLPALAIVFAHLARHASLGSTLARAAVCLAGQIFVFATVGPAAAQVEDDRLRLIDKLKAQVAPHDVVATVDIGWVGAAHLGTVVDLAGVTDPNVAALPGGHTSKRIPEGFFDALDVSHIVVLMPQTTPAPSAREAWQACLCVRQVEDRICRMPRVRSSFEVAGKIRSTPRLAYMLLRRTGSETTAPPSTIR